MTVHNEAKKEDIADIVIMPGDPLRAKYIAENFLEDAVLVNKVRNMFGYTGYYKGKRLTVFASGMGMSSMSIYAYELFKFYDVQKIIRIGSCGALNENIEVLDIILATDSYTEGNIALAINNVPNCHQMNADKELTDTIYETSKKIGLPNVRKGTILCNDFFDVYTEDFEKIYDRIPSGINLIGTEMESFSLFYIANLFGRKAACMATVVDSKFKDKEVSSEERQTSLNDMIKLALESAIK